ncbi:ATP-binding protein [Amycolatopsis sp. NPDC004625]|uniref:ATP-binding protein n=1 Tax=Amycolatopsis sp. NPDC004625 TaxID=3154670 RepID=UPI0033BC1C58
MQTNDGSGTTRGASATEEAEVDLGGRPDLRAVRAVVDGTLSLDAEPDDRFGAVLLVVDELVSNAYRHATTPRSLRVGRSRENVLIEVGDRDPVTEAVRPRAFGYGLRLVSQLSVDWGVRADSDGKVVWALVSLDRFPAAL